MKAQTKVCPARVPDFGMAIDQFRVGKNRPEDMEEIAECFLKLRELVPSIPQNKKLTKVQLLQHVIDYIMDLELTLDCQPTIKAVAPLLLPPCSSATERRPLAESSQLNTSHLNQGQSPKDEEMDTESEFRPTFC